MENQKLESVVRTGAGKGVARKLRASGGIPAVLYGRKEEPVSLVVDEPTIRKILKANPETAVIDLTVKEESAGSEESINVIIRSLQRHPATGKLLHLDFQRISLDEKIRVEVQITLAGEPRGVKEQGGVLEHMTRSLNIMTLPMAIPELLELDVSELMIGDKLVLQDLMDRYPEVEFFDEPELNIALVAAPAVEEEKVEAEEEEAEGAGPEMVSKDKEEGEETEEKKEKKEKKDS